MKEAERDLCWSRVFFQKKKGEGFRLEYINDLKPTRYRPEHKNNPKIRPETQAKYSQTHPKHVRPSRAGRVFVWAGSIAQSQEDLLTTLVLNIDMYFYGRILHLKGR